MRTGTFRVVSIIFSIGVIALSGVVGGLIGGAIVGFLAVVGAVVSLSALRLARRGLASAILVVLIPPGVLGESSFAIALAATCALGLVVLTYPRDSKGTVPTWMSLSIVAMMSGVALGMLILGFPYFGALYFAILVIALLAVNRGAFYCGLVDGLCVVLGILVVSYFVTWVLGFANGYITQFIIGSRIVELYQPFTLATGGPPMFAGTRRFAPLVGEPGLAAFLVIPLAARAADMTARRPARSLAMIVSTAVVITSQSLALMLAFGASLSGLIVFRLMRRRMYLGALVLAIVGMASATWLLQWALGYKTGLAEVSVTDRSLGGDSTALGNINLVVAYAHTPALALCLSVSLLIALPLALKSSSGLVGWVIFAITAAVAQPSQWQPGGWFLLAGTLGYYAVRASRVPQRIEREVE